MPREKQKRAARAPIREPVDILDELGQVGEHPKWMDQVDLICNMARHPSVPILILGPTGSGKEGFARLAHEASGRNGPFIAVNSNTLDSAMAQDTLFGHERGAFTGASAMKKGSFEDAEGGTLFLDEIGDLSPEVQGLLLRALQEREISRIGSTKAIKVDVLVVCATWRPLGQLARERRFREDLLYRLGERPITLPSLAERRGDIPLLVEHFLRTDLVIQKSRLRVTKEGVAALQDYHWPGNIRELRAVLRGMTFTLFGDHEEAGAEEVRKAIEGQFSFLGGPGEGTADAPTSPPPQPEAHLPEIPEDDFTDLSRREVECLRRISPAFSDAEAATAQEWVGRIEAVGMGSVVNGGTLRSKSTRIGTLLRRAKGRPVVVGASAFKVVRWNSQAPSKKPLYRIERCR